MSNADRKVLRQEARQALKRAMLRYEGKAVHVTIYALTRAQNWNDLQAGLARTDHPSDPERVSKIADAVEGHLESSLRTHLEIGQRT